MVYLVPLVNPDGADLAAGGLRARKPGIPGRAADIAAQYPDIPFPSGWKANLRGVDLNLNYPARWEAARRIKKAQGVSTPAPERLCGLFSAGSAGDGGARRLYALHPSGADAGAAHAGLRDLSRPGRNSSAGRSRAGAGVFRRLRLPGRACAAGIGNAGFKDWFLQVFKRPAFTIEAGLGENPLPTSQLPEITRALSAIFTAAMQW